MSSTESKEKCTRCNEPLKQGKEKWLELSETDGNYYASKIPDGHISQGAFPFGTDCATAQMKETIRYLNKKLNT